MLRQFLVSTAVSVCNIAIHALVMAAVLRVARAANERATSHQAVRLIVVMTATVSVLMAAHIAEVAVWSLAYAIVRVAPAGTDLIYFAFVNYTTLGYGDVTPSERWHLLGPMTAMNGVLLFGWSTAVIYAVLQKAITTAIREGNGAQCRDRSTVLTIKTAGKTAGSARRLIDQRISCQIMLAERDRL